VTYYFEISFERGEQKTDFGGRDMYVFVMESNRWWAVADHFSPNPV
jgi:hypothetical protein